MNCPAGCRDLCGCTLSGSEPEVLAQERGLVVGDAHDRAGVGNIPLRQRPQVQPQDCRPECGGFAMSSWGSPLTTAPHAEMPPPKGSPLSSSLNSLRPCAKKPFPIRAISKVEHLSLQADKKLQRQHRHPPRHHGSKIPCTALAKMRSVPPFSSSILRR